ncbi:hypothetical protein [Sporosarcina koreensis]|uniref:Uncharacterized protein n=1 Tax=Sporosarcina koreensis TaxID=334735 RepID=A0ABW0TW54_9BACL
MPERSDMRATIMMGAVAKGLMANPMAGSNPPAACKMAVSAAINAMKSSLFVGRHRLRIRWMYFGCDGSDVVKGMVSLLFVNKLYLYFIGQVTFPCGFRGAGKVDVGIE